MALALPYELYRAASSAARQAGGSAGVAGRACAQAGRAARLACLALLLALAPCGARVELLSGVSEPTANEVLAALLESGIDASKIPSGDGLGISVAQTDVARALDVLHARGLPRESFDGMGQIFRKEGLVSSPLEERARYIYALSQELSNTLSQMDGVLAARVHVVLPERGGVGEVTTPSTAAVFIKHQAGYSLDALQPQIRRLVTNSIPGLADDRVTVVLVSAQPAPPGQAAAAPAMRQVFGFGVASSQAGGLAALIAGLLLLAVALAAALAYGAWRYVLPARRSADPVRREPAAGQGRA